MATNDKIEKFLNCLDKLVNDLAANHHLVIHSKINQFFYMQKIEELRLLNDQVEEQLKRLNFVQGNLNEAYAQIFLRWSKDARWLNKHLASVHQAAL